ncbi:histidine-containing phosphotransfer protein 1-like [Hibiscus syriacus]|uniref:histidine-containing phosphotransfer protein 1-like n=1 Tax=Hibiscus syriacus TaxID=106335 RepID=UPI001923BC5D|nr:histidine-containing phosphotransfer protein 1-like [Hibiscus syriacus]
MVGTTLSQQLKNYIQTMHAQGMLDHHFDHVKALQNEENPQFVMDVISMFSHDAEAAIAHLTTLLNSAVVDFAMAITLVHQLRGSSSSIGGQRMAIACRDLRHACDNMDKERCLQVLERVKQEYEALRECLHIIFQLVAQSNRVPAQWMLTVKN